MLKKSIVFIALTLNLAACGGGDPITGKVQGNGQLVALISGNGAVYEVDTKKFEQWKTLANRKDKLPESKTELLSLRSRYVTNELVQQQMSKSKFLSQQNFDFDAYVKDLSETGGEYMSELVDAEEEHKQYIASVKGKKTTSDQAKAELDAKKQALQEQLRQLDEAFNNSRVKAASYFSTFNNKDYRVRQSLEKEVAYPERYQKHSSKNPIESCEEFVSSKEPFSREKAKSWVYGEQWTYEGRNYCPYFIMPGYSAKDIAKLRAQLPSAAIEEIRNATGAYIRNLKNGSAIKSSLRNMQKDNPRLMGQINAFDGNDKWRYKRAEKALRNIEEKKAKLLSTPIEEIEQDALMQNRNELKKAEAFYILGNLYDSLEKASDVQPDGTFTIKTESNYLFIVDMMKIPNPRSTEIAVLRVGEDRSEPVTVTADDFFTYPNLPKITFQ